MPQKPHGFSLKVLTINTHKGFNASNRRFILPELRDAVRATAADIVFLQEVMGSHCVHQLKVANWPDKPHYEFLADTLWNDFAYGRNAVYPEGDHGNAVLSRFPITAFENRDISTEGTEKRGLLHCQVALPDHPVSLHVICVHLGLRNAQRAQQLSMLCALINSLPAEAPVVVAGDFNDWQLKANAFLLEGAGMEEVFSRKSGRPARTFPARFPLLRLDRIYVRNAGINHPQTIPTRPWSHLSDHAPLAVELYL
ncbi:endonuclease/exonuclease/phosphatase family protein [Erwinia psidii]|uniref:Endonuclease/exonuclease/phosphatase family protein n=1 Tax=Erwinia psidii TaxID=69224 RepID=A0A3N6SKV5_9GAMM|nr:endonuclease/exonuclease/phosphatase family protein [Erwinia psidii]MCX8957276.1 endonuclease/exonuclease/phosphatase family protein [Erwinia psidii]MCX8959646.1 endonuclease/exonuclease/phosphatase family protein [Erwinia psidii]MCX8964590.1 endonuclease/exonuclease/phosphatase family protein [Erwinia psidii]RQM38296.1 endonuclease/exonuclease/phosphatase family protein [Erwinia psidii]